MSNKKLEYVKQSTIKKLTKMADYLLVLGERSNGKSYACKNFVVAECIKKGKEFIYLRRFDVDIKDSVAVNYFNDFPVETLTDGEYNKIDVYRKSIYLANMDDEGHITRGKKIGYCQALSIAEHYKSLAFPNVEYIIYEELISMNGRYLFNEPDLLQQHVSTIARQRKIKVICIGNLLSRICPYYREWGLDRTKDQKIGSCELYEFKNENGDNTKIVVYLTDSLGFNSGMYFGLAAKNITGGAYQVNKYPHMTKRKQYYDVIYTFVLEYNEFKFLCELLKDKKSPDEVIWYVQPKTTEIQKDTRVVSNQFSQSPLYTSSMSQPLNDKERRVFDLFDMGKVVYSDNLTGTEFNNILDYMF